MKDRTISEIGSLWPPCRTCGHIAQDHNLNDCGARIIGQCPTCHTQGVEIKCKCKKYNGPTWKEFKKQLTPSELKRYWNEEKEVN